MNLLEKEKKALIAAGDGLKEAERLALSTICEEFIGVSLSDEQTRNDKLRLAKQYDSVNAKMASEIRDEVSSELKAELEILKRVADPTTKEHAKYNEYLAGFNGYKNYQDQLARVTRAEKMVADAEASLE